MLPLVIENLKKKSIQNTKFVDEALNPKNAITKASWCMR